MKHVHKDCEHKKLTHCKRCDVVECECGGEWKKDVIIIDPSLVTVPIPYNPPYTPPYTWYGSDFTPSPYITYY